MPRLNLKLPEIQRLHKLLKENQASSSSLIPFVMHDFKYYCEDPSKLYDELKELCDTPSSRHSFRLMYHVPLKKVPLDINHTDITNRIIARWRLELGR